MSEDPIGFFARDFNFYRYTWNSPAEYTDAMGLTAYNCRVPLHAAPGTWGLPFMYHQYTCVKINGVMTCNGQDRAKGAGVIPPFRKQGVPSKNGYVPGKCRRRPSNSCFEQCLLNIWKEDRPTYGIPLGTDCQEYDDDVNTKCWEKCKNAK